MDFITKLTIQTTTQVLLAVWHNWPYLLVSILIATGLKLFVDANKVSAFLKRNSRAGVLAATTAAVATPLCSCGTTAVVLGMMAGMMPWAPIIAFMVASPLTSPEELVYSAGLFGWPFALAFFAASILLGLAGGLVGTALDNKGWLANQNRMAIALPMMVSSQSSEPKACECNSCSCSAPAPSKPAFKLSAFAKEMVATGKQLMVMFLGFAFIGYFLNGLIPSAWVSSLFGENTFSVPLAATLGLPLYISTEASLPLIRALLDAGMSQGAALAFMISGAGTSVGAIAGALTIARWRVIVVVVSTLWLGAMVSGYLYNSILAAGWI